jgi:Zn-dependent metalloprotease
VGALLAATLFVSSAKKTAAPVIVPHELDVRVAGGILRGGQIATMDPAMAQGTEGQSQRRASLMVSRAPDRAQSKALSSLERAVGSKLSVEYNPLTGTPHHLFAGSGYLTPQSTAAPEKIALDFVRHWQGIFRFSERDVESLKLKSRATLPDLGTTILLYEQQVDGVPIYKGEVMVNVNRNGQVINVGGDSYPQLNVTNSVSITPAQAVVAAAASLGFENFAPQPLAAKQVPTTF